MPRTLPRLLAAAVVAASLAACATSPALRPTLAMQAAQTRAVGVRVGVAAARRLAAVSRTPLTAAASVGSIEVTLIKVGTLDRKTLAVARLVTPVPSDVASFDWTGSSEELVFNDLDAYSRYAVEARAYTASGALISREERKKTGNYDPAWAAEFEVRDELSQALTKLDLEIQLQDVDLDGEQTPMGVALSAGGDPVKAARHGAVATIAAADGSSNQGESGSGLNAPFENCTDIAVAPPGSKYAHDVFVADPTAKVIWRVDHRTRAVSIAAGQFRAPTSSGIGSSNTATTVFQQPTRLAFAPNGKLYLADEWSGGFMFEIDFSHEADTGFSRVIPLTYDVPGITGMGADARGNLFATSGGENKLFVFDFDRATPTFADTGVVFAGGARGVTVGPSNAVWVVDVSPGSGLGTLKRFDFNDVSRLGSETTHGFAGEALSYPSGLAFDGYGNLWVGGGTVDSGRFYPRLSQLTFSGGYPSRLDTQVAAPIPASYRDGLVKNATLDGAGTGSFLNRRTSVDVDHAESVYFGEHIGNASTLRKLF